jgi:putative ABC transport system ATP-binding protein
LLSARDLHFAYARDGFTLRVPELEVKAGETLGLGGPSGTGKTTLLRLLCGILSPDKGTLRLDNVDVLSLPPSARRATRLTQCGLVFQDFALLDYLTVEQNVLLPLRLTGRLSAEHTDQARAMVDELDIGKHWRKLTSELSQGERQRVAVARALVHKPRVVLADEPTSSLDAKRKVLALELLTHYAKEANASLVMVTHDTELFSHLDRVVNVEAWSA